jgi:hypothetical protein
MDRVEGNTRIVVEQDASRIAERGQASSGDPESGMVAVATAAEGRAVWPLAATPATAAASGRDGRRPGADGTVGRCARLALTGSARVACAARRVHGRRGPSDGGAATAEYAIATMAAVAFAGLLVVILQSDEVRGMLLDLVRRALTYDR